MKRAIIFAALVAALVAVPFASAGRPYHFGSRAAAEKLATQQFVKLAKSQLHTRYVVRSIGCAKSGSGRADCAVTAWNPSKGINRFEFSLVCSSDAGNDCTAYINPWTAAA